MHRKLHAELRHRADDWPNQESPPRDLPLAVSTRQIHHGKSVRAESYTKCSLFVMGFPFAVCNPFFNIVTQKCSQTSLCGIFLSFTCFSKYICRKILLFVTMCYIGSYKWLNTLSFRDVIFLYIYTNYYNFLPEKVEMALNNYGTNCCWVFQLT